MNKLAEKVQEFVATDARATVEAGFTMRFQDEKISILADLVGSRKIRVWDVPTGNRVFLGTVDSDSGEGEDEYIDYIQELINNGPKAIVNPNPIPTNFSTPETPLPSSSSSGEELTAPKEAVNEQIDKVVEDTKPENNVNSVFASVVGGSNNGNVVSDSGSDQN